MLDWIREQFPNVAATIPDHAEPFDLWQKNGLQGVCTHPEILDSDMYWWIHEDVFENVNIPEGFYIAAIESHIQSERLFVAWKRNGRPFWFRQRYLLTTSNTGESIPKTRKAFDKARHRWERAR